MTLRMRIEKRKRDRLMYRALMTVAVVATAGLCAWLYHDHWPVAVLND